MCYQEVDKVLSDIMCKGSLKEKEFISFMNLIHVIADTVTIVFASDNLAKGICICAEKFIALEEVFEKHIGIMISIVAAHKSVAGNTVCSLGTGNKTMFMVVVENINNPIICEKGFCAINDAASNGKKWVIVNNNIYLFIIFYIETYCSIMGLDCINLIIKAINIHIKHPGVCKEGITAIEAFNEDRNKII